MTKNETKLPRYVVRVESGYYWQPRGKIATISHAEALGTEPGPAFERARHLYEWAISAFPKKIKSYDPEARIAAFRKSYIVDNESKCWLWTGVINGAGYGQFSNGKRTMLAHRWSYAYHSGPIPDDLVLDHLCRIRHCVNPQHLEAVTHKTNILRGYGASARNFRKTHCDHGHPLAGDNLIENSKGHRKCRRCRNDRAARERARQQFDSIVQTGSQQ